MVLYPNWKHTSIFFSLFLMLRAALESKQVLYGVLCWWTKKCFTEKTQTRALILSDAARHEGQIQPQALRGLCLYVQLQWLRFGSCRTSYWQSSSKIPVGLGWSEALQDRKGKITHFRSSMPNWLLTWQWCWLKKKQWQAWEEQIGSAVDCATANAAPPVSDPPETCGRGNANPGLQQCSGCKSPRLAVLGLRVGPASTENGLRPKLQVYCSVGRAVKCSGL